MLTRDRLKVLQKELTDIINDFGAKHKLSPRLGTIRFTPTDARVKLTFTEISGNASTEMPKDPAGKFFVVAGRKYQYVSEAPKTGRTRIKWHFVLSVPGQKRYKIRDAHIKTAVWL